MSAKPDKPEEAKPVRLGEKPLKPMPSEPGAWVWIAGEWRDVASDTADGVPSSLSFPAAAKRAPVRKQ